MRVWAVMAAAALLAGGGAARAANFDRLYVFGDSLVDSGNAAIALSTPGVVSDIVVPPSGRFTNGLNFADDLSAALGFGQATAFLAGGNNYAVGGAIAETTAPLPTLPPAPGAALVPPSLGQQITGFYEPAKAAGVRPAIDANSLVLVAIGGNDIRAILQGAPLSITQTATDVATDLQRLIADGARNILVVGLPDIGLIPSVYSQGAAAQGFGTLLSQNLNGLYASTVKTLTAANPGVGIQLFDLYGLQHEVIADPTAFGVDADKRYAACSTSGGLATNCQGYLYFDGIHPTAQVDTVVAARLAALVPEPASWMLLVLGFGAVGGAMRRPRVSGRPA